MIDKKKTCAECYGSGTVTDTTMSIAMGAAIGSGYFPMSKTCTKCHGSGRIDDK